MKRMLFSILGIAAITTATGCMAVSATDNSRGVRSNSEVVAVGNDVYLVDKRTGEVRKLDISNAKPFTEKYHESEVEADDVD
jgi:hypothetical protein